MMMDGTPFSTSEVNRTILPKRLPRPNSERYIPAPIPIGTPIRLAIPRIKTDPAMAFAIPPPNSPGGMGVLVKKSRFSEPKPL